MVTAGLPWVDSGEAGSRSRCLPGPAQCVAAGCFGVGPGHELAPVPWEFWVSCWPTSGQNQSQVRGCGSLSGFSVGPLVDGASS